MTLTVGARIYNGGDMANPDHFGTVTEIRSSKWGTDYQISPDADSTRTEPYWIPACIFSAEYKGNGLTRLVTEAAWREWRSASLRTAFMRTR